VRVVCRHNLVLLQRRDRFRTQFETHLAFLLLLYLQKWEAK
jgi:hypothetical protein